MKMSKQCDNEKKEYIYKKNKSRETEGSGSSCSCRAHSITVLIHLVVQFTTLISHTDYSR